jgi:hypothetical protein
MIMHFHLHCNIFIRSAALLILLRL